MDIHIHNYEKEKRSMGKVCFKIGILGSMGTYATIHMFKQYADIFKAEKEWDRPRVIIDNRCTMPSRVKAYLYNENVGRLIDEMTESIQYLISGGCKYIILGCNTSHLFLPEIFKRCPETKKVVVNIIDICVQQVKEFHKKDIYLLASEGTIDSLIYQNALEKIGIKCVVPKKEEYKVLRECIESVKQNRYGNEIKEKFLDLVNRNKNCILGCTELPVLYDMYKDSVVRKNIYDPVRLALEQLKKEYQENEQNFNIWSV